MKTRLDQMLSGLLLAGLSLAIVLMLVGAGLAATRLAGGMEHAGSISDLPRALAALEPAGFVDLGLLVLLATPVARVLALLVGFATRRAWLFSAVSLVVLAVLALSVVIGVRS
ncbi:MAG: DUF1634 domain-containing protein [Actinobacteria bacterium]|jgi:uncharacterized membrane protein|nr:DUF1634 domain-containing protein [Actinomycetota bacterium]